MAVGCLAAAARRICGDGHVGVNGSSPKVTDASTWGGRGPPIASLGGRPLPYAGMSELSAADLQCVELRHLYKRRPAAGQGGVPELQRQVVGAGRRCRHGWPQAIVYDPLYREKPGKHYRLGDTTRLTCPLLVSAIDSLEKGGAIGRYNERLQVDKEWQRHLAETNEAHRLLRMRLVVERPEELADVREHYGAQTFAVALGAGLASMRQGSADVKCLHAQVADELVRGGGNAIALQALKDIEDQGIPATGTDECCDNCNVHVPLEQVRWRLRSCKNSAGKRLSRQRKEGVPQVAMGLCIRSDGQAPHGA